MKWLYTFQVNRDIEVEETTEKKNDKGEEIKETKTIKKTRPVQVKIRKPSRRMFDDGELYYGVKLSEGIKAGLLTRAQLAKRYEDDGGSLSDSEKERYSEVYLALFEKENQLQRYQLNLEKMSDEEKKDKISALLIEMSDLRRELQEFEASQSALFDQTAENRAKNKTIMWWVLQLANVEKTCGEWKDYHWYNKELKGDEKPEEPDMEALFIGEDLDQKLSKYDELEESEDLFWNETIKKLAYFISYWYSGQAETEEDFQRVEEFLTTQEEDEGEGKTEGEAEGETKAEDKTEDKAESTKDTEEKNPKNEPKKEVLVKPEKTEEKAKGDAADKKEEPAKQKNQPA
ncbi:hypothetical protein CMI37_14855 [Candidatus Pacearchaeota archaeon]|nr:hypothetical protein [Candidatus Pacearchaeota archaeon]|tara:strand:- start:3953 stop:4987 length:1035 start_codon:yes stop_codon:yes gene_type:complete